ncbi:MAG: hypothetical protein PWQ57_3120 [Desulfovibrionales bacterium]|jgi:ubiquitin C-terminal hydrolase|nr:hypothetical protein [Desulfovibrionales bacterium]
MVLLFDQTKTLEKSIGEEATRAILDLIESKTQQELATKRDVAEVRLEIEKVRAEMAETKASLIKWMTGVALTQVVIIAALVKPL